MFEGLTPGMAADQIPDGLRNVLFGQIFGNWQRFGFGSEDEAAEFFGKSRLRNAAVSTTLMAGYGTGLGSVAMIGLPRP
jgi:hypothetical protein